MRLDLYLDRFSLQNVCFIMTGGFSRQYHDILTFLLYVYVDTHACMLCIYEMHVQHYTCTHMYR